MKKYQDGEIYFIRETDYSTGNPSTYVKIGLVRYSEKRDSFGRLAEHQTGNPRRLLLDKDHVVKTQAVDMVEAHLHTVFAESRISGEWFELHSDKELQIAIQEARRLAAEAATFMPIFEEANRLLAIPSNGLKREATADELELIRRRVISSRQVTVCENHEKEIKAILTKAYSEGKDIEVAAKTSVINFKPEFDLDRFEKERPDLWNEYQGEIRDWYQKFSPVFRAKESDLDSGFNESISRVRQMIDTAMTTGDFSQFVEVNLLLTNLKGLNAWEARVTEAKLKVAIGEHEEITQAFTWVRKFNDPTYEFSEGKFAQDHPDTYRLYIGTPTQKATVKPKKTKK
jgi:hypothetical protein